jgi:hypothetical protein
MQTRLIPLAVISAFAIGGCSLLVTVDRSKVPDDLFHPSPDAGSEPVADAGVDAAVDAAADDAGAEDAGL